MSLVLKALAVVLLVTYTIAAPVEEQLTVNVEIPAEDDSAPLELPSLETVQDDQLLRTKRQFGLGDLLGGIIGVGYGGGGGYNNYGNYGNRYGNGGYGGNYNGYNGYNNYNNGYGNGGYNGHHHHHHDDNHGHGHYDHYDDHYDHHHHH